MKSIAVSLVFLLGPGVALGQPGDSAECGELCRPGFYSRNAIIHQSPVLELIEERGIDFRLDDGMTPFHLMLREAPVEDFVRAFLSAGADVSGRDPVGVPPLVAAAGHGIPGSVALLLEAGADVNARSPDGTTVLHAAAMAGPDDTMRLLIDVVDDVSPRLAELREPLLSRATPLHLAVTNNRIERARLLIDAGADISLRTGIGTPLHHAARFARSPDMVWLLIEAGEAVLRPEDFEEIHAIAADNPALRGNEVLWRLNDLRF